MKRVKKTVSIVVIAVLVIVLGSYAYSVFSGYAKEVMLKVNNHLEMDLDKVEFYISESGKELYWGKVSNIKGGEVKEERLSFPSRRLTQDGSFRIVISVEGEKYKEEYFGYFTNGGPPSEEGFIFNIFNEKVDITPVECSY